MSGAGGLVDGREAVIVKAAVGGRQPRLGGQRRSPRAAVALHHDRLIDTDDVATRGAARARMIRPQVTSLTH